MTSDTALAASDTVRAAASAVRAAAAGDRPLHDNERDALQQVLDRGTRRPWGSVPHLLPGKVIFHPRLAPDAFAFAVEHIIPTSVEILAHASGHTTVRAGHVWFDFRGRPPAFEWMDKHRFDGVDAPLVRRLLALHLAEGGPAGAPRQFGFSAIYMLPEPTIRQILDAFSSMPAEVPWEATGARGDTCLSLATGVLAQLAPSLGVTRCTGAEFFVQALGPRSRADVIGFYTGARFSLFDFVADVIAQHDEAEGRIRALLAFVPPPLQPALDAALRGGGSAVPTFAPDTPALVPPLPPWTLAAHAFRFLCRRSDHRRRPVLSPGARSGVAGGFTDSAPVATAETMRGPAPALAAVPPR
jgi:hypothetical protein